MSTWVLLILAVAVLAVALAVATTVGVVVGARRRRPLTRQEKLTAAAKAARELRRSGRPRRHRDTFERGTGVPDRHSAAILENSVYGDAADFGGGDTGGSDGGGGSY